MASLKQLQTQKEQDEQGYTITVRQVNGKPYLALDGKTPSTFTVYGSESPTYIKRRAEMYRELAKQDESHDDDFIAICVAACAIKDWSGWDDGQKELPCTPENVRAVMAYEHIRAQVSHRATKGQDFFGVASPDSAGS